MRTTAPFIDLPPVGEEGVVSAAGNEKRYNFAAAACIAY
jgi:hypothetical protein